MSEQESVSPLVSSGNLLTSTPFVRRTHVSKFLSSTSSSTRTRFQPAAAASSTPVDSQQTPYDCSQNSNDDPFDSSYQGRYSPVYYPFNRNECMKIVLSDIRTSPYNSKPYSVEELINRSNEVFRHLEHDRKKRTTTLKRDRSRSLRNGLILPGRSKIVSDDHYEKRLSKSRAVMGAVNGSIFNDNSSSSFMAQHIHKTHLQNETEDSPVSGLSEKLSKLKMNPDHLPTLSPIVPNTHTTHIITTSHSRDPSLVRSRTSRLRQVRNIKVKNLMENIREYEDNNACPEVEMTSDTEADFNTEIMHTSDFPVHTETSNQHLITTDINARSACDISDNNVSVDISTSCTHSTSSASASTMSNIAVENEDVVCLIPVGSSGSQYLTAVGFVSNRSLGVDSPGPVISSGPVTPFEIRQSPSQLGAANGGFFSFK